MTFNMKANAPEKIYIYLSDRAGEDFDNEWGIMPLGEDSIEYTRTDTFIEKVREFLSKESNIPLWDDNGGNFGCDTSILVENFIKYIKGEQ